ncbi:hypothetical protein J6590_106556, partial [Homalodisca vitripennis]
MNPKSHGLSRLLFTYRPTTVRKKSQHVTFELPPMAWQVNSLQGQDRSAVTHPRII